MQELQKEAEAVLNYLFPDSHLMTENQRNNALISIKSIATSKYVQAEKLRAQIEVYQTLIQKSKNHFEPMCQYMISERDNLQEQLKTLNNDTNRNE